LSLLASATYLLNDLFDLTEDRPHWSKKNRPLARFAIFRAAGAGRRGRGCRFLAVAFVFSVFIFPSLSAAKRQTEITRMVAHGLSETPGRGYRAIDAPLVLAMGIAMMVATVLIMAIYLVEDAFPAGFYKQRHFLCALPLVLFYGALMCMAFGAALL
jgi:hypothetical protein